MEGKEQKTVSTSPGVPPGNVDASGNEDTSTLIVRQIEQLIRQLPDLSFMTAPILVVPTRQSE